MAKSKKNRKNTVDLIKKASKKQASLNPFELHVNKSKFNVLGQKSKNDVGLPGVSRNKAIQKRKVTLLQEYKLQDKTNRFFDRRIGERNKNMTKEDKIMARFTAEKMKAHNKQSSLFNLDDDVVLTHQGRTLEEIEQFEDPRSDEEDDDDGRNMSGKLDSEFVKEAHFGGGMLSVSARDGEQSRKDLISQLITDSKKRKAEKQLLKESTTKLTEQLDSEWKDLRPLLNPPSRGSNPPTGSATPGGAALPAKPAGPVDKSSFDYLVKELRFEATGKPSDKLKSEDEIVRQEKDKLERLERERLKRMSLHDGREGDGRGRSGGRAYRSADDLDDGFAFEPIDEHKGDNGSDSQDSEAEEGKSSAEDDDEGSEAEETDEAMEAETNLAHTSLDKTKKKATIATQGDRKNKQKDDDHLLDKQGNEQMDEDNDEESGEGEEEEDSEEEVDSFDDLTENEEEEEEEEEEFDDEREEMTTVDGKESLRVEKEDDVESDGNDKTDQHRVETMNTGGESKVKKVKFSDKDCAATVDKGGDKTSVNKRVKGSDKTTLEKDVKGSDKMSVDKSVKKGDKSAEGGNKTTLNKAVKGDDDQQVDPSVKENQNTADAEEKRHSGILKNVQNVNEAVEFGRIQSQNDEARILETDLKRMGTDLPFTFEIPSEYEELVELFAGRNEIEMKIILERMIKVNHWSLGADNKARLNQLFAFLLQYLDDSVDSAQPQRCWRVLSSLTPVLFDLCLMDPDSSGDFLRNVVQEKYHAYARRDTRAPTVQSLLFLKLVSSLFPTSDARHYVTTPALVFLCHALARVSPVTQRDMSVTLFLATLALEYIHLSKRYLPELVNYLQGCLLLFCRHPPLPPNRPFKPSSAQLFAIDPRALTRELAQAQHADSNGTDSACEGLSTERSSETKAAAKSPSKTKPSPTKFPSKTMPSPTKSPSKTTPSSIDDNVHVLPPRFFCVTAQDLCPTGSDKCSSLFGVKAILSAAKLVNTLLEQYGAHYEASYLIFMRMRVALDRLSGEVNSWLSGHPVDGEMESKGRRKPDAGGVEDGREDVNSLEVDRRAPVLSPAARRMLSHVRETLTQTVDKLDAARAEATFSYVAREKEKPKILRLFEPEIKPVLKFHTKGDQREREKLMAKYKKEMKGAMREIRKDGRFMQKVKLREMSRADAERKRKVKEILGGCANQEGEIRGLKRKKK